MSDDILYLLNLIPKDDFYEQEKWKRINDDLYRDNYLISNLGRVCLQNIYQVFVMVLGTEH